MDADAALLLQDRMEEHGIKFLLGETVEEFRGRTALMESGREEEFDVLVLALGVRANVALVKEAGGETEQGILVDTRMQTSLGNVYAAGDCTQGDDISLGSKRVLAILPNAYMQGECAGINMAGGKAVFDKAIPMNSIGFFGLRAMTAGSYYGEEDGDECYEERSDGKLKRLFRRNGLLTGFILIGDTDRAGIYTSLIREKTPLDTINYDLLKKVTTFAAFSEETRGKKFGGVV